MRDGEESARTGRMRDRPFLPGGAKRMRAPPRCRRVSALEKKRGAKVWASTGA